MEKFLRNSLILLFVNIENVEGFPDWPVKKDQAKRTNHSAARLYSAPMPIFVRPSAKPTVEIFVKRYSPFDEETFYEFRDIKTMWTMIGEEIKLNYYWRRN